ncbi:MAG: TonB-dependent siderophore receptor [Pseudomonadota bacterium]
MPTLKRLGFTLCLLSLSVSQSIHAQDADEQETTETADSGVIEEVIVTGRAKEFYLETDTTIGSKIDLDLLELPQSAQVLTEQLIIDQAARDITDLYRSIAGVSEFSYSGVTFRGFRDDQNLLYDGVRGDPFSGFSVPQIYNIERVEVLKGPAAALYGRGQPGGVINYVTKKPSFERQTELLLTGGNFNLIGGAVDTRGPVSESVAYRGAVFYEQQDLFRDNADSKNLQVAGGLLFLLSPVTTLTTTAEYIDQDLGGHRLRGVLADDDGNFIVPREFNTNEAFDFQDLEAWVLQGNLRHEFSPSARIDATLRYLDNERAQKYHEPRGWVDVNGDGEANQDDGVIAREYRDQVRTNEEISLTVDFSFDFETGSLGHQFLIGGDYFDVDTTFDYLRARFESDNVLNLNVFEPNYGETDPSTYNLTDLNRDGATSERLGLYVQDYISFNEQWSVLLGFRYSDFEDTDKASGFVYSDDHIAPRAGLIFQPVADASIYLNYSESYNPVGVGAQEDVAEEGFLDPETGNQVELGWKHRWLAGAILTTVAIYEINREDVPQANPNDTGPDDGEPALVSLGEVESRGVELTLVGDLTDRIAITANYAYNDVEVVEGSAIGNTFGDRTRFANAPEHQFGVWARYALLEIDSSIAFGADYVSEQFSLSGQRVKPYTVFDASWTTTWDQWNLQINVRNLLDEEYAVSGFIERTGHFPGAPREFIAQLRYTYF